MKNSTNSPILHIDSSLLGENSATIKLTAEIVRRLSTNRSEVKYLDLSNDVPLVDGVTAAATLTPGDQRTPRQNDLLAYGQRLIDDLKGSGSIVIGMPMYNFGPPARLKAWADLVARAGETFTYTETGVEGLVEDRPVYIAVASGGVPIDSPMDWATGWLRTFLGFLGITSVHVIAAEGMASDPDRAMASAMSGIDKLLPVVQTN